MAVPIRRASGGGQQLRIVRQTDFTGGVNLAADKYKLAPNESPDMMNVDVDRRGGFQRRKGMQGWGTASAQTSVISLMQHHDSSGNHQILLHTAADIRSQDPANPGWNVEATSSIPTGPCRAATMNDVTYICHNGEEFSRSWDGTTITAMADPAISGWHDDYAAPSSTDFPKAKHLTVRQGFMYVGNTVENTTAYPNRVRWSHPSSPTSWRQNDFIDINVGQDADEITALVPFADHLLIFKKRSVYALYGFDADSFQVVELSKAVGTFRPESVVLTPEGVYFWSGREGVYRYDGTKFEYVFDNLFPAIQNGDHNESFIEEVAVGWVDNRLWVTVPWGTDDVPSRTFVYDSSLGRRGAWVVYDIRAKAYTRFWTDTEEYWLCVAVTDGSTQAVVNQLEVTGRDFDSYHSGLAEDIDAYYNTPWVDVSAPETKKRWGRPEFLVTTAPAAATITVDVFRDWDGSSADKSFAVTTSTGNADELIRASTLGLARSVSLKFTGPVGAGEEWEVHAVVLKFRPKPVRS